MGPIIQLRWYSAQNKVTAQQVQAARNESETMMQTKHRLQAATEKRLQYRISFGEWQDVPTVSDYLG